MPEGEGVTAWHVQDLPAGPIIGPSFASVIVMATWDARSLVTRIVMDLALSVRFCQVPSARRVRGVTVMV